MPDLEKIADDLSSLTVIEAAELSQAFATGAVESMISSGSTGYDRKLWEHASHWYNIQADLPEPLPPVLHPGTKEPIGPQDLAPLFPMGLIAQEVSQERYIEIPDEA